MNKMSQPLTFTRFLECLDKANGEMRQVHHATTNRKTLMLLLDSINVRHVSFENGPVQIYGIPIGLDGSLPDNVIKMDGRMYNTGEA